MFGREGRGLNNNELAELDVICSIPASAEYPVLNLGQAATVVFYELRSLTLSETQLPDIERERADEPDIDRLHSFFTKFLTRVEGREYKRQKTALMLRRLLGRANPTQREVSRLTGLFRRANNKLSQMNESSE